MNKQELIRVWRDFAGKNGFVLSDIAGAVADGVLANEKESGLRMCPCRLSESRAELLCPCNFKAQAVWKEKGRCWCGLFVENAV